MPDDIYPITADDKWANTADDAWSLISGVSAEYATTDISAQDARLQWEQRTTAAQTSVGTIFQSARLRHTWSLVAKTERCENGGFETLVSGTDDDATTDNFESWTEGAFAPAGTYCLSVTDIKNSGTRSVKITGTAGSHAYMRYLAAVTGSTGNLVKVSFFTRGDGSNPGQYRVYDAALPADPIIELTSTGVPGTDWTRVEYQFPVPAYCDVLIFDFVSPDAGGDTWFDDVSIQITPVSISGQSSRLLWHQALKAENGTTTAALQDAALNHIHPKRLIGEHATVAITGQPCMLAIGIKLLADTGTIGISLYPAALSTGGDFFISTADDLWSNTQDDEWYGLPSVFTMTAAGSSVAATFEPANLRGTGQLTAEYAAVSINLQPMTVRRLLTLRASQVSITVTGYTVTGLEGVYTLTAETGYIQIPAPYAFIKEGEFVFMDDGGFEWTADLYARLLWHQLLKAEQQSVAISGQDVRFRGTRTMKAAHGTVTATGQPTGLFWNQLLKAQQTSVAITGFDAVMSTSLTLTMLGEQISVSASTQPALALWHRLLIGEQGSAGITGQDVLFGGTRGITASSDSVTATGQNAELYWHQALKAEAGEFAAAMQTFAAGTVQTLKGQGRDWEIEFEDATLGRPVALLIAEQASVSSTLETANITWERRLIAETANVAMTEQAAELLYRVILYGETGSVTATWFEAVLRHDRIWRCDSGAVSIAGQDADFYYGKLRAEPVTVTIDGQTVTFIYIHRTPAARLCRIAAENRVINIAAESRTMVIPEEERLMAVGE